MIMKHLKIKDQTITQQPRKPFLMDHIYVWFVCPFCYYDLIVYLVLSLSLSLSLSLFAFFVVSQFLKTIIGQRLRGFTITRCLRH